MLETLVDWLRPAFGGLVGYVLISVVIFLERSVLIGLLVPGEVILVVGAIQATRDELSLTIVIMLAALSAFAGESLGYWLGRRYGVSLITRLPFVNRVRRKLSEVEELFARHGGKTVAVGRFAVAAGAFVPFVAGMGRMSYPRFLAFDAPAILAWAVGVGLLGFFFGENLELLDRLLSRFGWAMFLLLALGIAAYVWRRRRRRVTHSADTGNPRREL